MKKLLYILLASTLLTACIKNNPDPSWLEVNKWQLLDNSNISEGELTENFSDVQVFVDGKLIGIFEAPFKIPLLIEGVKNVRLYPVIRNNGISATKKVYPFVESYEIDVEFVKNSVVTINPTTYYSNNSKFWIEDFEDASVQIKNDVNYPASISMESDPSIIQSFNGNFFGRVNLTTTNNHWIATTDQKFNLESGEIYLEIDYHNTNSVITGLIAHETNSDKNNINIQLNAQDASSIVWKKIYIELGELVLNSTSANSFDLYFEGLLPDELSSSQINIDNIKLVHF